TQANVTLPKAGGGDRKSKVRARGRLNGKRRDRDALINRRCIIRHRIMGRWHVSKTFPRLQPGTPGRVKQGGKATVPADDDVPFSVPVRSSRDMPRPLVFKQVWEAIDFIDERLTEAKRASPHWRRAKHALYEAYGPPPDLSKIP